MAEQKRTIRPYEKLVAWQEAYALCLYIYKLTGAFPKDERFGIISQMRRAAESVTSNIAEGNARRYTGDKARFFNFSQASLEELHSQTRISWDLGYCSEEIFLEVDDRVNRVSYLITKLRDSQ